MDIAQDFPKFLVIISGFISLFGSSIYIRDTIKGKTKPNRVTWSLWAVAPLIGTAAALSAGADPWATFRTFMAGFMPLLILIVSILNKKSYWKITRFDITCGLLSGLGILLWLIYDSAQLAIIFAVAADGLATLPTVVKAWKFPETESGKAFIWILISVILVFPSIKVWNIENSAFQIYLLIANALILTAIYRKKFDRIFLPLADFYGNFRKKN